jgi:glycosyltransferase involved in cell wall biosynthesis
MDTPTLSLIAPLHNEAPNLPRLLEACADALERTGESWEILLIDDGSDDGSWAVIQDAMKADRRVRGLRHPQRLGKTQAYATGFRAARGQYLFTLDADLQEDPAAIPAMLERLRTDADMVVGWRRRRRDPLPKVLASWRSTPSCAGACDYHCTTRTAASRACVGKWRTRCCPT